MYNKEEETRKTWAARIQQIKRMIAQEQPHTGWRRWKEYNLDLAEIIEHSRGKLRFEVSLGREKAATAC